ncbi:hypothetical protein LWM68_08560 [Niabella sp. W65]|nr:hypothetical protein [Niabella sp. W65]MCH7362815.1 hypothetical protein [Niabella sp. W65]
MEGSKTVPAIEELRQVEEHITVKQLLAGNRLYVNFHNNIALDNHHQMTLPPGILLTLADNVLTHGKLTDPATPAVITAAVVDNRFCFTTANYKRLRTQ